MQNLGSFKDLLRQRYFFYSSQEFSVTESMIVFKGRTTLRMCTCQQNQVSGGLEGLWVSRHENQPLSTIGLRNSSVTKDIFFFLSLSPALFCHLAQHATGAHVAHYM